MKNYIKLLLVAMLAVGTFACEPEQEIFEGPYFVRFTSEAPAAVPENVGETPIAFTVHVVGPQPTEPVTVNYEITGDAVEGEDFEIVGGEAGSVTIPANESFGTIAVRIINNEEFGNGNKTATLRITGVSGDYEVGQFGGEYGQTFAFTIIDDDCELNTADFEGVYSVTYTDLAFDQGSFEADAYIRADPNDPKRLIIEDYWGEPGSTIYVILDPCPETVEVPAQPYISDLYGYGQSQVEGVELGSFNPATKGLTFTARITVSAGSFGDWEGVFVKQE